MSDDRACGGLAGVLVVCAVLALPVWILAGIGLAYVVGWLR